MTKFKPLPNYGHLIIIKEFTELVEHGMLIDYDGSGNWATQTYCDPDKEVIPSEFLKSIKVNEHYLTYIKPKWATHVLWFNR